MQAVTTIGLDIAKSVFQVTGPNSESCLAFNRHKWTVRSLLGRPSPEFLSCALFPSGPATLKVDLKCPPGRLSRQGAPGLTQNSSPPPKTKSNRPKTSPDFGRNST